MLLTQQGTRLKNVRVDSRSLFFVPELAIWRARCLHFGVLGHPGTILWRLGTHFGIKAVVFLAFCFRVPIIRGLRAPWTQKGIFLILALRFLFLAILGSVCGRQGLFGIRGIAKNNFRRNRISHDYRILFS